MLEKQEIKEYKKKGLIIVFTGNGKGKTTAALGIALRAMGYNYKVFVAQFIKGSKLYGELESAKKFGAHLQIVPLGEGFTWETKNKERDIKIANEGFEIAKEKIFSGEFEIIILDEINYVISYNYLAVEKVIEVLKNKPNNLHIILTGRNAHPKIIKIADLVTEMKEIKHPFKEGITAQKGIEF